MSLATAVHLVSSSAASGQLIGARINGAKHCTDDRLTIGPCDVDPARHEALRRTWNIDGWRLLGLDDLRAAIAGDDPVVLWGTTAYSDLVWLWWALDALRRIGADGPRFLLARPQPADARQTLGGSTPEEARVALEAARPITSDEWREGPDLWQRFASPSPLAFDEARRAGSSVLLSAGVDLHGAWFPRLRNGRLHLSELDELLLAAVADWRTTNEILDTLSQDQIARLVWPFDPFFSITRLRAWAAHGVLDRQELTDRNPYAQDRFRATGRTRALLRDGLASVAEAPPLHVGGCVVHDPASPWVRVEDASGWHLAQRSAAGP